MKQSGTAVVMAILIVALAAMLAASLASHQAIWVRSVENQASRSDAKWLALAGTDFASAVLNDDARNNVVDYLGEAWSSTLPPIPVDNGEISGYITDQQGLFNLNNLAVGGKTDPIQIGNFRRLLTLLQLNPDLAQAVADWIDADDEVQSPGGAENSYYLGLPDPYRAANMPLETIDDLSMIKGFDETTINMLKPYVTALPGPTKINVDTAPPEVLSAIMPGLTLSAARALASSRSQHYFADVGDFAARIQSRNVAIPYDNIQVASQYFLVTVKATQGRAQVIMRTLLDREGSAWPRKVWKRS